MIKQTVPSVWKNACSVPTLLSSQLQSPAEPELLLRYCDGSQHGLCEPAVTDLGGEPEAFRWESGCGCGAEGDTPGVLEISRLNETNSAGLKVFLAGL